MIRARLATRADVPAIATALAAAFRTDPVWRWLVPDQDRYDARAPAAFRAEAAMKVPNAHVYTVDDATAAALWSPPGRRGAPLSEEARLALPFGRLLGPRTVRQGLAVQAAMKKARPAEEHWYLAMLGTHPDHQGRGLGSTVLQPVLERCDLDGTGAYLESSKLENIPFYERHGFRVTGTVTPAGSPPLTLMWRDPRPVDEAGS